MTEVQQLRERVTVLEATLRHLIDNLATIQGETDNGLVTAQEVLDDGSSE